MGAINKVVFGSDTLIDLTADTVAPETLAAGITAHDKSGAAIVGTKKLPVYETWIFELEDGSTVEKQVEVSA